MSSRDEPAATCASASTPPAGSPPAAQPAKLAARQQREAEALRANLRKRKDQMRAREMPKQE